jgi:phage host-nuclease inhibitor protein Gam
MTWRVSAYEQKERPRLCRGKWCKGKSTQSSSDYNTKERAKTMSELLNIETEGFVIDSDAKAEWALKKIKEAREDRDRWVSWYKEQIEKINKQTDFDTLNLERMLAEYFATVPHKKTKTQESYTIPGGKLILKTQNPEYIRDDKTVIEWLKKNNGGQFVKVKEELAWSELKGATSVFEDHIVTEDGEVVPGIEVIEREAKFVVEV